MITAALAAGVLVECANRRCANRRCAVLFEVDLPHRVAAVGQELRRRVLAPRVVGPRAAVRQQHQGRLRGQCLLAACGTSQRQPVTVREATAVIAGQIRWVQLRVRVEQRSALPVLWP